MSELDFLRPDRRRRVYDLLQDAGVDVSDWANYERGEAYAASNPKYCYEWAYIKPNQFVVLNLWYELTNERNGVVSQNLNVRASVEEFRKNGRGSTVIGRAKRFEEKLIEAFKGSLPVRAIICDGNRRESKGKNPKTSSVKARWLDPVPWAVTKYNQKTGAFVVTRGAAPTAFVDQFSVEEPLELKTKRKNTSAESFVRSSEVRKRVLDRANGECEWCGEPGFVMHNKSVYLETHHIVPLAEKGPDSELNVVALCANDHRKAHFCADYQSMRSELLARTRKKYGKQLNGRKQIR